MHMHPRADRGERRQMKKRAYGWREYFERGWGMMLSEDKMPQEVAVLLRHAFQLRRFLLPTMAYGRDWHECQTLSGIGVVLYPTSEGRNL